MSSKTNAGAVDGGKATFGRTRTLLAAGAGAAVLIVAVLAARWARGRDLPRLNDDTVTLARFVSTPRYSQLSFDRQQLYMKVLEDREDSGDLKRAYQQSRLTESEYRAAVLEAWLGEQLKRSERFASLEPGAARGRYIVELLDRKLKKESRTDEKPPALPEAQDDPRRDETLEKLRIEAWPEDARARWQEYRKTYREFKRLRETPATRPVEP